MEIAIQVQKMKRNAANSVKGVRLALCRHTDVSLATFTSSAFPKVTPVNADLQELGRGEFGCCGIAFIFLYARKWSEKCRFNVATGL